MKDPIGAFEEIRRNLILYIRTAFGTQFPTLEEDREALLNTLGILNQEPWIEPLPTYESSGKTIDALVAADVPSLNDQLFNDFRELAKCGLVGDYELHRHQLEMLTRASEGQSCVVTAGTGSGKTEAFLLPLFAYLTKESATWNPAGVPHEHWHDWWHNDEWRDECIPEIGGKRRIQKSLRVPQRAHEDRPAAVRALILYPMNALVEDQLSRLRRALDSPEARARLHNERGGNRIYIGRYTGDTPVPGHELRPPTKSGEQRPDRTRIVRLASELSKMDAAAAIAEEHALKSGNDEIRYFFPRLDGSEMRSRWDMQDGPPDILITNYSMLSIMLMREADAGVFEKTRLWLENDDAVFHLIVDELHVYRGTAGTEVAYLLRLLLNRLGLEPNSPKLRILASSASLEPDDPDSEKFLTEFFGTDWTSSQIIPGHLAHVPQLRFEGGLPPGPFTAVAEALDGGDNQLAAALSDLTTALVSGEEKPASISDALVATEPQLTYELLNACTVEGEVRAVPLSRFAGNLFSSAELEQARKAARGLLFVRGLAGADSNLPSFRIRTSERSPQMGQELQKGKGQYQLGYRQSGLCP